MRLRTTFSLFSTSPLWAQTASCQAPRASCRPRSRRPAGVRRAFILLAVTMVGLGLVGVVGLIGHSWLMLFSANLATAVMFIGMFALMVVSMMIGYNYTDPIKDATLENWLTTELEGQEPVRQQMESQGVCKALATDGGACNQYYPKLSLLMAAGTWNGPAACSTYSESDFATSCEITSECASYDMGNNNRYGCKACDAECFDEAVRLARENMEPLAYVAFVAFFFLVVVAGYNDYLMERDSFSGADGSLFDGARDQMENIGIAVNGFNAFMGFILFVLGIVYSSDTGAAVIILLLGVMLMGACSAVAGGIYLQNRLTPLLLLAGNAGTVGLAFLLLLAGIIAALSAGIVTGIGEKIDDDWDTIRGEMQVANPHYCAYMDDDQCKLKIRNGIQDQAVNLAWIMLVVLCFLVGKIFLTHRASATDRLTDWLTCTLPADVASFVPEH